MITRFDLLPDDARVWIFTANQKLNAEKVYSIQKQLDQYLAGWTAHGNSLLAAHTILQEHFLVIGLNQKEADASGCSIDSLFRMIKTIGENTNIDFLNRENVALHTETGITLVERKRLKQFLTENSVQFVYNTLVNTKGNVIHLFKQEIKSSWVARFLPEKVST
ncbi:MAG: hypothetical protein O9340_03525 [Cyclobacteriaceae bacterium]|jgi:hypothetical protein|nr:hypothetical protein [Cyclobacteriaceae bacterium]